jgi:hypothetical protein
VLADASIAASGVRVTAWGDRALTIYELLRRLVEVVPFPESERFDALKLLGELEDINALGTVAKQTEVQAHECRFVFNGAVYQCATCGKQRRNPSGTLSPSSGRIGSWP